MSASCKLLVVFALLTADTALQLLAAGWPQQGFGICSLQQQQPAPTATHGGTREFLCCSL
jgi:hypothetical protein